MIDKRHIDRLAAIITVSTEQLSYFQNMTGGNKVFLVPHGIDTDFFQPRKIQKDSEIKICLFVGWWLRDIHTLREAIKKISASRGHNIKFIIVTLEKISSEFAGLPQTEVLVNIPENKLMMLYNVADLLLLPIMDCTANNSCLEAMACGLPIVTTDVGGVRDYLDDTCAIMARPGDITSTVEAVLHLLDHPEKLEIMGKNARQKVESHFAWPIIAEQMRQVYQLVSKD